MQFILHAFSQAFGNFAPFFILLGLLIFVHEFGHFIVARLCGVRVETFSLGFGKKIFNYKPGVDKAKLQKTAEMIRDEIRKQTPTV